jgi:hypothetical protein
MHMTCTKLHSLGGNCKTTMMAMISPALESFPESLSTLKFANRAKTIKNLARVNEDLDQRGLLRRYEQEIKQLRNELANKSQEIVDKRKLLQLEELRRRAEVCMCFCVSHVCCWDCSSLCAPHHGIY